MASARKVLARTAAHHRVVLLHGEAALAGEQPLSDVDLAVTRAELAAVADAAVRAASDLGLRLVSVWPYDCRGLGLFFASADLSDVVHLDLLADDSGWGKYGVRTDVLVAAARPTDDAWLRPDTVDRLLYLLSKRTLKGETSRVAELVAGAGDLPRQQLQARARSLLAPFARARVLDALGIGPAPSPASRTASLAARGLAMAAHRARRVRHPVGAWVHVVATPHGEQVVAATLAGDGPTAPDPGIVRLQPPPEGIAGRLRLAATVWRRGAVVTVGTESQPWATTTVPVNGADAGVRASVVAALQVHAERSLRVHG